ncbi:MAG: TrmB family transcriptional regulator [Gemmatimonadota bacterium]
MASVTRLVERLGELGMSTYEAKVYLALITAGGPLNGYEVAKSSGVPRSTVYETLAKLVARGAAFETRTAKDATCYVPLPPNALLNRMSHEFEESLQALRAELPSLAAPSEAHLIHNISGYDALLERSADVIRESQRDLFVSIWPEETGQLRPALAAAEQRGVDVTMLVFGEKPEPIGHTYRHRFSPPDFVLDYLGYRLFAVVGDNRQAVIGGLENGDGWGIYTDNPAVVLLATEYVRHDIAMQLLGEQFGARQVTEYVRSNPEFVHLRAARAVRPPGRAGTAGQQPERPGRGRRG